jgi:hypothetical protein
MQERDEKCYTVSVGKPGGKTPLGAHRVWMEIHNRVGGRGLDSSGSGQGPVADCCEHGNEPYVSIKGREFILESQERLRSLELVNLILSFPSHVRSQ